jgi:hypothetical protein
VGRRGLWHYADMARTTEKAKRRAKKKTRGRDAIRMVGETMKYFAANPLKNDKRES